MPPCISSPTTTRQVHRQGESWLWSKKSALVLGDSHARVFYDDVFSALDLRVFSVKGASAYGLKNPRSVTGAAQKFREAMRESNSPRVIFLLGGVDTDFLIWHRAGSGERTVEGCLEESLSAYRDFLSELKESGTVDFLVISAPLPTVRDQKKWGQRVNAGRPVTATLRQRTQLTLDFNARMKVFCRSCGISFLDLDPLSVGPDGFVAKKLRSKDQNDHHYPQNRHARLIVSALKSGSPSGTPLPSQGIRMAKEAFGAILFLLFFAEDLNAAFVELQTCLQPLV